MWPAMDLGNRGVFMKLGKFETERGGGGGGGGFSGLKVWKMEWARNKGGRNRRKNMER